MRSPSSIAGIVALATLAASPGAAGASQRVVAFPGPGWRAASPATGITFHGVAPAGLRALRVTGSQSGAHDGRLRALRIGRGAVFTPAERFRPGERVTVRGVARLGTFRFTVARPAADALRGEDDAFATGAAAPPRADTPARSSGVGTCTPRRRRFHTRPRFRPVGICVIRPPLRPTVGARILVTPKTPPERQQALMILRNDGRLLWYRIRRGYVRDLKTVRFRGRRMLAFYQFRSQRRSHYVLMNRHYRVVRRIRPGNGLRMNMHDLQLTPRGTAYFGAYQAVHVRRLRGLVTDFVLQERDLHTGQVLFEWHSLDHVRPSASYEPRPEDRSMSWDYFHGNSIDPPRRRFGTILVSARNTSAVYGISRRTGRVLWTFGGRRDDFGLVRRHPRWQFCGQHDVRRLGGGELLFVDNGGRGLNPRACPLHQARVMRFRLHRRRRTVRLVRSIPSGPVSPTGRGFFPPGLGSARLQRHGELFVSWGTAGVLTALRPGGQVRLALRLGRYSYRAVRAPWVGRPRMRPKVAVRRRGVQVDVWASWNGATNVRRWRVLAGPSRKRLRPIGRRVRFAGLETRIRVPTRHRYVAVRALGKDNRRLARSRVRELPPATGDDQITSPAQVRTPARPPKLSGTA